MKIVLIDDDYDISELTKKVLTINGYAVQVFHDAQQAIMHIRQNKPNLILMDVMLPGLSGPEIVQTFQLDKQLKDIPVVFLTGLVTAAETSNQDEGMTVGGLKYSTLGKPYEIDQLLNIVKKYLKVERPT